MDAKVAELIEQIEHGHSSTAWMLDLELIRRGLGCGFIPQLKTAVRALEGLARSPVNPANLAILIAALREAEKKP